MKTVKHIILAVLCLVSATMSARQFEQGEKIYVNADQSFHDGCFNWAKDGAKIFLYVWKKTGTTDSGAQWITLAVESGSLFSGSMPAGDFNRCIVIRGTSADWSGKWNQTGDLTFPEVSDRNYISKFWEGGTEADWLTYAPAADKIGAFAKSVTAEDIHICSSALGGPYSLHVKLKSGKSDYDYDNVQCHGWYKSSDGNTWTSVDAYAGNARDGENDKDIINNVLPSSGTVYYYLHSAKKAGCRLLKIVPDATGCDLDCTITSFEVACSEVNANDTTYTLDGMVAFGEPNGDLVITCDGKSTTIKAADARSPQTFSIPGLRAATSNGKTTTAQAKFTGNAGCSKTKTFTVPNAKQGIVYTYLDVPLGETTPLNPSGANYANEHKWYIDGVEQPDMQGAQTSIPYDEPNTTLYTYREFNPPAGDMNDMLDNGGYEQADANVYKTSPISEYDFWGKYDNAATPTDYYAAHVGASNGFAVVQSANNFAGTYAKVTPREGSFFALFDAASGSTMAGKKAWFATTANNPNLKLQKGTTYLFSFWAANINNYGEMDNAAKLQFQIEYNGKTVKLGEPLDLNKADFRNNRWHQCSSTFYADADAATVTISVVNLNNNSLNIGNDFALDDIQFRAVSSVSRAVRIQQVFVVQTYNPCVDGRIFRKWDNVLFVNNGDSIYTAYQWYKNDQKMNGETLQRLYTASTPMAGTTDLYHCVATRKDGTTDKFCAHMFNDFPESRLHAAIGDIAADGISVAPTQLAAGQSVTVCKTFASAVHATLLTLTGQTISTTVLYDETNTITMPATAGLYLLRLQSTNVQRTVKINVL
ncbi:MAG: T9SS type A sorting domain-containing protein [Paludibacteraceae bacterium]|nr:T9SS type A sorting domain-containing protein [Paludibacteraceae bacterium]